MPLKTMNLVHIHQVYPHPLLPQLELSDLPIPDSRRSMGEYPTAGIVELSGLLLRNQIMGLQKNYCLTKSNGIMMMKRAVIVVVETAVTQGTDEVGFRAVR